MSGVADVQCPHCHSELAVDVNAVWYTCAACDQRFNIEAQQAFARAEAAFLAAQEHVGGTPMEGIRPNIYRAKTRLNLSALDPHLVLAYQQAYSGLSIALRYDLPQSQKHAGIEMMVGITQAFAPRAMLSPLEAEYWTKLMIEVTALGELQALEDRLNRPSRPFLPGFLERWRWRLRRHQLTKALGKLQANIKELEHTIGFLDPPYVH